MSNTVLLKGNNNAFTEQEKLDREKILNNLEQ